MGIPNRFLPGHSAGGVFAYKGWTAEAVIKYLDVFRPILSFGAHAALTAVSRDEPVSASDAAAIFAELDRLVQKAFAHKTVANGADFDDAWFAVAAWLDEKLAPLRTLAGVDSSRRLQRVYFDTLNAGEEFFTRLENLLQAQAAAPTPERGGVLDVYDACLDLGFLGRHYRGDERLWLNEYRRRISDVNARIGPGRSFASGVLLLTPGDGAEAEAGKPAGMFWIWLIPIAVTIGLYFLFRTILSSMFSTI